MAATAATAKANVFPPRPPGPKTRRKRHEGAEKAAKIIGFRPPPDLNAWIEETEAGGYSKSDVILRSVRIAKDAAKELGDEWWEVEKRANVEGVSPGTILGRLALAALQAESKKR